MLVAPHQCKHELGLGRYSAAPAPTTGRKTILQVPSRFAGPGGRQACGLPSPSPLRTGQVRCLPTTVMPQAPSNVFNLGDRSPGSGTRFLCARDICFCYPPGRPHTRTKYAMGKRTTNRNTDYNDAPIRKLCARLRGQVQGQQDTIGAGVGGHKGQQGVHDEDAPTFYTSRVCPLYRKTGHHAGMRALQKYMDTRASWS